VNPDCQTQSVRSVAWAVGALTLACIVGFVGSATAAYCPAGTRESCTPRACVCIPDTGSVGGGRSESPRPFERFPQTGRGESPGATWDRAPSRTWREPSMGPPHSLGAGGRSEVRRAPTFVPQAADAEAAVGQGYPAATPRTTPGPSGGPTAPAGPMRELVPTRAYVRATDIPPPGIGAYGVVSFRARPTSATRARLLMTCAAYKAYLPPQMSLPSSVRIGDQMLTIWPLDNPSAPQALADNCSYAIDHYDLYGGISAIRDAERQGAKLDGDGPFLLGWSPSTARGSPNKLVLVIDMSLFASQDSFNQAFLFWQKKVVQSPELWRHGFEIVEFRLAVKDFADQYGSSVIEAIKLGGAK